ncbi:MULTISPECIES: MarR family winged helix-turn-helix transcriptional regulator [Dehalococcoides]|jgi:DNA-binding MarR family transcriptional regulator|uniref:MarR family winged helix-turn-helix transcriptional regulator n=1 Tax=Dehalococcoides TaxID=61434 RepID=UPI0005B56AF5|nr:MULTISPECIES: MarR family transcriptional regulator [Dehalococcoides]BAQ34816.1 MarR family transcriptional regulator [Dehalococcoides sp. UCH007]
MEDSKFRDLEVGHFLTIILHHTTWLIHNKWKKELKKIGLTGERFALIHEISLLGKNANPASLARKSMLEPHAISALLTRMEKDGLIRKSFFEKPKNMVRVELTQKGEELRELAWQITPILNEFWENCLTSDELKLLFDLLAKLNTHNLPSIYGHNKTPHNFIPKYDQETHKIVKFYVKS